MNGGPSLPGVPLWRLAAIAAAVGAAWLTWDLQSSAIPRLDQDSIDHVDERIDFMGTRALEREWIDEALPAETVFAPEVMLAGLPGLPCANGVDGVPSGIRETTARAVRAGEMRALANAVRSTSRHWLPSLTYATVLLDANRVADAEQELELLGNSESFLTEMNRHRPRTVDQRLGRIFVLHGLGYAQIRNRSQNAPTLLNVLRAAIREADVLGKDGHTSQPSSAKNWYDHRMSRPGCSRSDGQTLSTFDLYNNLIQLYLLTDDYSEDDDNTRQEEFRRDYGDSPERNPMLAALRDAKETKLSTDEAWVWAVSNTERLLRNRREAGLGPPENPRLALTLAQVMSRSSDRFPFGSPVRRNLWREVVEIIETVDPQELPELAPALLRLELLARSEGLQVAEISTPLEENDDASPTARAVRQAVALRRDATTRAALLSDDAPAVEGVAAIDAGGDLKAWIDGLRLDAAAALARAGLDESTDPAEAYKLARGLAGGLGHGGDLPPEVESLGESLGTGAHLGRFFQTSAIRALVAFLVGAVVFVFMWWLALQARMHKHLFTSFYRLEAQHRLRGGR